MPLPKEFQRIAVRVLLLLLLSAINTSADGNSNNVVSRCDYSCLSSAIDVLRPVNQKELLDSGGSFELWYRPRILETLDNIFTFFKIPLWSQIRFNLGVSANSFTGSKLQRRYRTFGVSPGVIYKIQLDDEMHHELFAQYDQRIGFAYASRTGNSSSGLNLQPALFAGYLFHGGSFHFGPQITVVLSSDSTPFIAGGFGLRFGYSFETAAH